MENKKTDIKNIDEQLDKIESQEVVENSVDYAEKIENARVELLNMYKKQNGLVRKNKKQH